MKCNFIKEIVILELLLKNEGGNGKAKSFSFIFKPDYCKDIYLQHCMYNFIYEYSCFEIKKSVISLILERPRDRPIAASGHHRPSTAPQLRTIFHRALEACHLSWDDPHLKFILKNDSLSSHAETPLLGAFNSQGYPLWPGNYTKISFYIENKNYCSPCCDTLW